MLSYVVYQIYLKSFKDTTGSGIGDLNGICEKLDYIKNLGVDYIWITPFYVSPQADNGYDVADYYNIDPIFGTMQDFKNLISEANKRDIKIMMDMVFNHCSTEHEWFKKAIAGDAHYLDYFIWRDTPTNWISKFGGSAWEFQKQVGKYYLHLFDKTQADLNWENKNVRQEIFKIINFWISLGVKGFRFDVINLISKKYPLIDGEMGGKFQYTDGPKVHDFLRELRANTFKDDVEFLTVGEMSSTSIAECVKYAAKDGKELNNVFHFHHLKVDYKNGEKWSSDYFDLKQLKSLLKDWQEAMADNDCVDALFWSNHDQPRVASRFIKVQNHEQQLNKNKMLATLMYLMRGVAYIYQGEELGMENVSHTDINKFVDIESLSYFKSSDLDKALKLKILNQKSRDNGRTPMQWDASKGAGFSKGEPWVSINDNYLHINVETQLLDSDSTLNFYKKLIKLKKNSDILMQGDIKFIELHDDLICYERALNGHKNIILCNFSSATISIQQFLNHKIIFSNTNHSSFAGKLGAFDAYVLEDVIL